MLLLFIRWNRAHLEQWSHMLKNAKWTTFLFTIFVPRLWPTRIERHCNQCESVLAAQVRVQDQEYQTTVSISLLDNAPNYLVWCVIPKEIQTSDFILTAHSAEIRALSFFHF